MGEYLALVYENWRSTRGFYLFCLWFGLYGAFSMWIFAQIQPERFDWGTDSSAESLVVLFSMSQVVWLFMLIAASGELNDLKFTIPQFHLRLPVSTWKLVAARMSFGVLSNKHRRWWWVDVHLHEPVEVARVLFEFLDLEFALWKPRQRELHDVRIEAIDIEIFAPRQRQPLVITETLRSSHP